MLEFYNAGLFRLTYKAINHSLQLLSGGTQQGCGAGNTC